MWNRTQLIAYRLGVFFLVVLLWELLAGGILPKVLVLDQLFFSRPTLIVSDLYEYAQSGLLLSDTAVTLWEAFLGLLLGILTGVLAGMLLGHFRKLYDIFDPYLVAFNSLPRPALAPLLVLWLGLGALSKIFLAWSLVFFIVFYNTTYGIRNVDADITKAIKVMGASHAQIIRIVIFPSVFSWIFAAFRTSVSFSLVGAVVGEFVGSTAGLGYRSVIAAGLMNTDRVFSILIVLMLLGTTLVSLSTLLENRVLKWRPQTAA